MANRSIPAVLLAAALCTAGCQQAQPVAPLNPGASGPAAAIPTLMVPPPPATATAAPAPAAQPCDATTQLALQTAIGQRAKTEAPGMKPDSTFVCMVVPEGGSATMPLQIDAGRCYTLIGDSLPDVSQLDIVLKLNSGLQNGGTPLVPGLAAQLALLSMPLAQSSDVGPKAAIGKGRSCYKNPVVLGVPVGIPAMIEVRSRTGAGAVAVQVYSR